MDAASVALAIESYEKRGWIDREDPLSSFTLTTRDGREHVKGRQSIESILAGVETVTLGANSSGKTHIHTALFTALAQGRRQLGDIMLPLFHQPSVWWVLCQTAQQQVESTQSKVLEHLGAWPHRIRYSGRYPEAASLILIKPIGGSDDPRRWSRMWFHVEGSAKNSLPGGRVDGTLADEPPSVKRWREVRWRMRGNERMLLAISMTPLWAEVWIPLLADFKGCETEVRHGRRVFTWQYTDNVFLGDKQLREMEDKAYNDPHGAARLYGTPVDERGAAAFAKLIPQLDRWQKRTRDPRMVEVELWNEREEVDGTHVEPLRFQFEMFYPWEPGETYYCDIDPSLGIDDDNHDEFGIHIYARRRQRLVARAAGYVPPYAIGWLAGIMTRYYHDEDGLWAETDIEENDRLITQVVRGMRAYAERNPLDVLHGIRLNDVPRFAVTEYEDRTTGLVSTRLGWTTTTANRGELIGGCMKLLLEDSVLVHSRAVLTCLRNIKHGVRGIRGYGRQQDQDMILLGRFAVACGLKPVKPYEGPPPPIPVLAAALGELFPAASEPLEPVDWGPGM